ncbi:MAG: EAL domain-containing protein [Clostridium sp.]
MRAVFHILCLLFQTGQGTAASPLPAGTKILNALHRQEFELFLQPKVNTKTRQVVGAEALLRWIHNGVCIPLQEFLPVADQNTCIRLLDTYMFERVCQLLAQRHAQGEPLLPISINVSKASFEDGHYYLGEILDICKRYGVDPSLLELELHEDIPFEHKEQVQMFVQRLKGAGLRCSLMILEAPLQPACPELDQCGYGKAGSFLFAGSWNSRQQILLQHIIPMLHTLHIPILAEGVETQEQVQFLTDLHCTLIQGFYYSPPVSVHQFFQENEIIE